jgi:hypothetical protein
MHNNYIIEGAEHKMHQGQLFIKDGDFFPNFQPGLNNFKNFIINLVENNIGKSFVHFGDGDYYFLKKQEIGSATPGKRALSIPYTQFDITPFRQGWAKADYHCVEYLEANRRELLNELYPNQSTIPTEYLYGLTMNKWFFKQFAGKIGLIGANSKLKIINELMQRKEYQEYLGLEKFNDYIEIPEKFACDNLNNTINMVKKQLEQTESNTKIYLFGVGHVKSGLIHELPKIKNAVYVDIGAGIDAIAGLIDRERPYAYGWINYRMKNYNYSGIDLLHYRINEDINLKIID